MRTVFLDNEAVQVLSAPGHRQHRTVLAHLAAVVARRKRGVDTRLVVPTAVRVEAGWDRTAPRFAALNRFRVRDAALDEAAANDAAAIVARLGVSVADAHLGAVARATPGEVVVLTSDPPDITRAAAPATIVAVRI